MGLMGDDGKRMSGQAKKIRGMTSPPHNPLILLFSDSSSLSASWQLLDKTPSPSCSFAKMFLPDLSSVDNGDSQSQTEPLKL